MEVFEPLLMRRYAPILCPAETIQYVDIDWNLAYGEAVAIIGLDLDICTQEAVASSHAWAVGLCLDPDVNYANNWGYMGADDDLILLVSTEQVVAGTDHAAGTISPISSWLPEPILTCRNSRLVIAAQGSAMPQETVAIYFKKVKLTDIEIVRLVSRRG